MFAGAQPISAGDAHSMLLKQDGSVWATGYNANGELGDGTLSNRNTFVQVVSSGQCGPMALTIHRPHHFCPSKGTRLHKRQTTDALTCAR